MVRKPPEIPALTGLRGVAAYSVLFAHALNFADLNALPLTNLAYFSMSLFFTLSGFVIHYNYGKQFAIDGVPAASGSFLLARFARLYPLYFVGLILSVSFIPGGAFFHHFWIALSCLTLTQTWFDVHGATGGVIGGSWSISTEFALYILFIPFAAPITRMRRPLVALALFCMCSFAVVAVLVPLFPSYITPALEPFVSLGPPDSMVPWQWVLYVSPPIRALQFFAGALAAQLVLSGTAPVIRRPGITAAFLTSLAGGFCATALPTVRTRAIAIIPIRRIVTHSGTFQDRQCPMSRQVPQSIACGDEGEECRAWSKPEKKLRRSETPRRCTFCGVSQR